MKTKSLKNNILIIVINPFVFSLIISLIVIYFLPPIFKKYEVTSVKKERTQDYHSNYYEDLDNDGYSEKIDVNLAWKKRVAVVVYSKGKILDQWNFEGEYIPIKIPFWGDINNDGIKEIFVFTLMNDTIYIHCFNPKNTEIIIQNKVISSYKKFNNTIDCSIFPCGFFDCNNDNSKEFYFSIITGFSGQPRKMFALDIKNDTLYSSPESCINIYYPFAFDFDSDGKIEFTGNNAATDNCKDRFTFTDTYTWLAVFNEKMNYKFEPIKIGNYPAILKIQEIRSKKEKLLCILNIYFGKEDYPCSISLINSKGQKIKEKQFDYSEEWKNASFIHNESDLFIIKNNGELNKVDINLNLIKTKVIAPVHDTNPVSIDVDQDSINEFVFLSADQENLIITRNDFSHPVLVNISGNKVFKHCSVVLRGEQHPELFILCDQYLYFFQYYQNPLYNLKYLVYFGIYVGFLAFILLIQKAQKYRLEQKYIAEKQIAELQLKSIKNQTDPHFTLNIINSIGALFSKNDTEQANYVFGKYSKLLRSTILSSDKIFTTISEELDYVTNYLELEKFRLTIPLEYKIEKDESIDPDFKIPKLIIHTFVENAIKHGIRHLKHNGELKIEIRDKKSEYVINITDNGIGREKAKEYAAFSTGKGLEILRQMLDLYYSLKKIRITYAILDLYNEQKEPAGTTVTITIPINESQN